MPKTTRQDRATSDAADKLRAWFPVGSTVYTVLRHRSSSGMTRHIGILRIGQDGDIRHPNYAVGEALGLRVNKAGDGVVIAGAGMDMGFHVVYELAALLYGDGYALHHRWI